MPTLPWAPGSARTGLDRGEVVVMASRFELTSYRDVPAFFLAALRVHQQVRRADGAIGVSLVARPLHRTFFTVSSWTEREAVTAMIRCEPHRSVMTTFRECTADSAFVFWTAPADVRPDWADAYRRLGCDVRGKAPRPTS
ncbi:hypothetical protein [Williamsia deligens]|uniref:DUF3291 domain-containing protein n=1 Tax=Williamsia deligens TaxID=321325 RepID=A0ABW3G7D7_9NOCA|nr:hypothetical protein [Williamsia deligens]MCP2193179.1 protein of unknown function (DUF3291) [Williamsia deligens]